MVSGVLLALSSFDKSVTAGAVSSSLVIARSISSEYLKAGSVFHDGCNITAIVFILSSCRESAIPPALQASFRWFSAYRLLDPSGIALLKLLSITRAATPSVKKSRTRQLPSGLCSLKIETAFSNADS